MSRTGDAGGGFQSGARPLVGATPTWSAPIGCLRPSFCHCVLMWLCPTSPQNRGMHGLDEADAEPIPRCWQTGSNQSQLGQTGCPFCRAKAAPLGESGGAVGLEPGSAGEAAVHRVQVPPSMAGLHALYAARPDLGDEHGARAVPPEPDCLVADLDAALVQQFPDVAQREWQANVQKHRQGDDFRACLEPLEQAGLRHGERPLNTLPPRQTNLLTRPALPQGRVPSMTKETIGRIKRGVRSAPVPRPRVPSRAARGRRRSRARRKA